MGYRGHADGRDAEFGGVFRRPVLVSMRGRGGRCAADEDVVWESRSQACFQVWSTICPCGTSAMSGSIGFRCSSAVRRWRARLVAFWLGGLRICVMLGGMQAGGGFSSW
jgi:hypothetical protein